jgi:hypothetical protein
MSRHVSFKESVYAALRVMEIRALMLFALMVLLLAKAF